MKKEYSNKQIHKESTKEEIPEAAPKKSGLVCIKECEMPWIGAFKAGERVTQPELIARIGANPNFVTYEEEK